MNAVLRFEHILTPGGIERHKRLVIDDHGRIAAIEDDPAGPGRGADGWLALPGMPNAHSHTFQRAMTGRGEGGGGEDSFWSWREAMYGLALTLTPEQLYPLAARAFADMLRAGFTSVAEFHYLHHRIDGSRGPEMGRAVAEAAAEAGIRLVLLPVLYQRGGFGRPPESRQRRFVHDRLEDYLELLQELGDLPLGIAPHSLRAVDLPVLGELVAAADRMLPAGYPRHIHIAEQRREVEECLAATGARPVELLAGAVDLDSRWSLVHGTHVSDSEMTLMTDAGVTTVLCPLTEAYLGDGVFPARRYVNRGGRLAVGSDSNVRIDAVEELRWLEYGQRLMLGRRACLATGDGLGAPLWRMAAEGGAAALAQPVGAIEPDAFADLVVLDPEDPTLAGLGAGAAMDGLVTGGSSASFSAVYVGGQRRVHNTRHVDEARISAAYRRALDRIEGDS
jgi:formimidoylglutamate deiminase